MGTCNISISVCAFIFFKCNKNLRMQCLSDVPPHGRASYIEPLHSVQAERKQTKKQMVEYLGVIYLKNC